MCLESACNNLYFCINSFVFALNLRALIYFLFNCEPGRMIRMVITSRPLKHMAPCFNNISPRKPKDRYKWFWFKPLHRLGYPLFHV